MNLQTKRLILRAWQESDAESLFKYAKNPNIGPIAGWQPHSSIEDSRKIIKNVLSAAETYAVVLKETGEAIGSIGLMRSKNEMHSAEMAKNEGEIGYWIGEPFWGQDLIPEAVCELLRHAFEDLRLTAVWCGYYDGNEKSKRTQEKCGFVFHHTEYNKSVPLMNDFRTEHFTKILYADWKNTSQHLIL
jgi:RimJ/RimL family protein N-acetyltransferase